MLIFVIKQFQTKGFVIVGKRIYAVVFMVCLTLLLATGCSGRQPAETAEGETSREVQESEGASAGKSRQRILTPQTLRSRDMAQLPLRWMHLRRL